MSMHAREDVIQGISRELQQQYGASAVLLYGSQADGSAGPDSDYDIAAFAPVADVQRDNACRDGIWRDIFVYPLTTLRQPHSELFKLRHARVLHNAEPTLEGFLTQLETLYQAGPKPLPAQESAERIAWSHKMLQRISRGDAEGNFRRAWLLTTLLEDYFALRCMWYQGPKKALRWLAAHQPQQRQLFDTALAPAASLHDIAALVHCVTSGTD